MNKKAATLKYQAKKTPLITALGENELADEMIELAKEYNIPFYQNADLVNLLCQQGRQQEIPEALYEWVACILAFAFFLKDEVPEDFSLTHTKSQFQRFRQGYHQNSDSN